MSNKNARKIRCLRKPREWWFLYDNETEEFYRPIENSRLAAEMERNLSEGRLEPLFLREVPVFPPK